MAEVGAYEAKTHLPRLLERVAQGERITITRHGVAIAELVPAGPRQEPLHDTIEALRAFRRGRKLDGLALRELIDQGRR
jgi:prevent-host-death family protein